MINALAFLALIVFSQTASAQINYYNFVLEKNQTGVYLKELSVEISDTGLSHPYPGNYSLTLLDKNKERLYKVNFGFAEKATLDVFEKDKPLRGSVETLEKSIAELEVPYYESAVLAAIESTEGELILEIDLTPYFWEPPTKEEEKKFEKAIVEEAPLKKRKPLLLLSILAIVLILIGVFLKLKRRS